MNIFNSFSTPSQNLDYSLLLAELCFLIIFDDAEFSGVDYLGDSFLPRNMTYFASAQVEKNALKFIDCHLEKKLAF